MHRATANKGSAQGIRERRDAIVAISSHVARGTVGNRAAAHAIEALGHPVWSVPTVLLPWHPGHGAGTRVHWPASAFGALMDDLAQTPQLVEVGAVLSGYLGAAEQTEGIARLVRAARAQRSLFYCCDPVIGNEGGRYVATDIAEAIRDRLMPLADIVTPNRFELAWLLGDAVPDTVGAIAEAGARLGPRTVLVTSASVSEREIGTVLIHDGRALIATHERIDAPNAGTGDLVSGLFLARTLEGEPPERALRLALSGAAEAVAAEAEARADELPLERIHDRLRRPVMPVRIEHL